MIERWLIGTSLAQDERGPLEFGAWLHGATGCAVEAVHVAPRPSLAPQFHDELEVGLRGLLEQQVTEADLADLVRSRVVAHGSDIAGELIERAAKVDAGLLIGRTGSRAPERPIHLGRVARRILRRLPSIVGVVPPDFVRAEIGSGPVVVAIDPFGDADAAVGFARWMAERTERELVAAHVFDPAGTGALGRVPEELAQRYRDAWRGDAEGALRTFIARHALQDTRVVTADGPTVDNLLDLAASTGAALLVCGARRISTAERIFEGSTGALLAATSTIPVMIAPASQRPS